MWDPSRGMRTPMYYSDEAPRMWLEVMSCLI